ncbi:MAG TPA: YigZ family protein [Thermoanaerobaculia bacterium]|nr:YigZ family protein [Thermoanaerobaculia bacterium]
MSDHYRTIAAAAEARLKIERSDFLGIAFPVTSEEQFFAELKRIEKQHFDATHHCWAFRLFAEARQRSSDAGEPGGTAGRPILAAISDYQDIGVVVVRWYGGVKLGTGGLSRAYRDAAAAALREAVPVDRYVYQRIRVTVPFETMGTIYRMVEPPDIILIGEHFGETNVFELDVRLGRAEAFGNALRERRFAFVTLP